MIGRLLLPLCFFLWIGLTRRQLAVAAAGSSSKVVTTLPGFDGLLPFNLETGYVEVDEFNGTELFYYFVESEAGGENDPFLLWLTGGDHCSVLSGLALEIGPFQFVLEPYNGTVPSLQVNPYSWTKVENILFVDTPVGAGFSFSRQPEGYDVGEVSTSLQLHEFLIKWFTDHPSFLANPLYIGGDSKAGKIVPFIAQKISEGIGAGRSPLLNMKGYLVGNPATGERLDASSRVPYAHGFGIISDQLYETIVGHCEGEDYKNPINALCGQSLVKFYSTYGTYLSYFWANDESTREALGIKDGTVEEWVRCHSGDLPYASDIRSSLKYHRNVTANGYRALVYRFTITYSNNMTFATVKGAGHTAPEFEPERCFAMFSRWILNQQL